jgi:hypothetical protein
MTPAKRRAKRKYRAAAWIGLAVLGLLAFVAAFHQPPATVTTAIAARQITFTYHPRSTDPETGRPADGSPNEKPLFAGTFLDELLIRSFDSIRAESGTLSVRTAPTAEWVTVSTGRSLAVTAADDRLPAVAIFSGVGLSGWRYKALPEVTLAATTVRSRPSLRALIDDPAIQLSFGGGAEAVEFKCQLCRIDGVAPQRMLDVRLSDLYGAQLQASTTRGRMTLHMTPGNKGIGDQQFRLSDPRFCGGEPPEPQSTLLSAHVTFKATGKGVQVLGPGSANPPSTTLRFDADTPFDANLTLPRADLAGGREKQEAIGLTFSGRATNVEVAPNCDSAGNPIQPSLVDVVRNNRIYAAGSAAIGLFLFWLGLPEKWQRTWSTVRGKEEKQR